MKTSLDANPSGNSDEPITTDVVATLPVYCDTRLIDEEMDLKLYRQRFDDSHSYVRIKFKETADCELEA